MSEGLSLLLSDKKTLDSLNRQIDAYMAESERDVFADTEDKVSAILAAIESSKEELESVRPKLATAQAAIDDQDRQKRQLKSNIEILRLEKDVETLDGKLDRLRTEIGNVPGGATAVAKAESATKEREHLIAERSKNEGRWSEIFEQIRGLKVCSMVYQYATVAYLTLLQRKLSSPEYKDVDEKHRVAVIKYETTIIAADDLKKYGNALDKVRTTERAG